MTEEEIKKLKDKIDDGAAMAHDPMCSEGFSAARELIKYYEAKLLDRKKLLEICYKVYEKAFDIGYDWSHYESIEGMQECAKLYLSEKILLKKV